MSEYLDAKEAAALLGVSVQTLYAYVSRGAIRSEGRPGTRKRRYRRAELEAFLARRARKGGAPDGRLHYGQPVLDSAITRVTEDGRLLYRGRDAVALSRSARFEQVAMLIWAGDLEAPFPRPQAMPEGVEEALAIVRLQALRPIDAFAAVLPLAGARDPSGFDRRPEVVRDVGARILRLLVCASAGGTLDGGGGPVAAALQRIWVPEDEGVRGLIEAALVLCAEHELNVSAFTARCVASAGSSPYAVVAGGLAALSGPRHGGHVERVWALFAEAEGGAPVAETVDARLQRGERVPGFEHPLYPGGDPRGRELFARVCEWGDGARVEAARALVDAARSRFGGEPTIDVGLVTLARALGLGAAHAVALFAIARTVGWIGHALEQYAEGTMIRPRARYTGAMEVLGEG